MNNMRRLGGGKQNTIKGKSRAGGVIQAGENEISLFGEPTRRY